MKLTSLLISAIMASKREELIEFCRKASNPQQYLKVMNRGSNLQELKQMLERQQTMKHLTFNAKMAEEQKPVQIIPRISRETTQGTTTATPPQVTSEHSVYEHYYENTEDNDVIEHEYYMQHDAINNFMETTEENEFVDVNDYTTEATTEYQTEKTTEHVKFSSESNVSFSA